MKIEVNALHQIEITSECNLRCVYCPSPKLGRPKVHMSRMHYARALEWAEHYVRSGTQFSLNLAGIGESTLHPDFVEYVAMAREAVGPDTEVLLASNGLLITEELIKQVAPYNLRIHISLHRPEKAAKAVDLCRKYGLLSGLSIEPAVASINWAGQVDWPVTAQANRQCMWIGNGMLMAMADGRLTTCCLDSTGAGVVGHVDDTIGQVFTKPYKLCQSCDQIIQIEGYDQRQGTYQGIQL